MIASASLLGEEDLASVVEIRRDESWKEVRVGSVIYLDQLLKQKYSMATVMVGEDARREFLVLSPDGLVFFEAHRRALKWLVVRGMYAYGEVVSVAASKKESDVFRFHMREEKPFVLRTDGTPFTFILKQLTDRIAACRQQQ